MIPAAVNARPQAVQAEMYLSKMSGASAAVRLDCNDGRAYVVKGHRELDRHSQLHPSAAVRVQQQYGGGLTHGLEHPNSDPTPRADHRSRRRVQVNVPEERYREIVNGIANEQSPVGIDAKKTHVMILYMLEEIDKRLARVEENIAAR